MQEDITSIDFLKVVYPRVSKDMDDLLINQEKAMLLRLHFVRKRLIRLLPPG
jgi:hypothetical protein